MADQNPYYNPAIEKLYSSPDGIALPDLAAAIRSGEKNKGEGYSDRELVRAWAKQAKGKVPEEWTKRNIFLTREQASKAPKVKATPASNMSREPGETEKALFGPEGITPSNLMRAATTNVIQAATGAEKPPMEQMWEGAARDVQGITQRVLGEPWEATATHLPPGTTTALRSLFEASKVIPRTIDFLYTPLGVASAVALPAAPPAIRAGAEAVYSAQMATEGAKHVAGAKDIPEAVGGAAEIATSILPVVHARRGARTAERMAERPSGKFAGGESRGGGASADYGPPPEGAKTTTQAHVELESKYTGARDQYYTTVQRHGIVRDNLAAAREGLTKAEHDLFVRENSPRVPSPEETKAIGKLREAVEKQREHVETLSKRQREFADKLHDSKVDWEAAQEEVKVAEKKGFKLTQPPRRPIEVENLGERIAPQEVLPRAQQKPPEVLKGRGTPRQANLPATAPTTVARNTVFDAEGKPIAVRVPEEQKILPPKQYYTTSSSFRVPSSAWRDATGRPIPVEQQPAEIPPDSRVFYKGRNSRGEAEFQLQDGRVVAFPATMRDPLLRKLVADPRKYDPRNPRNTAPPTDPPPGPPPTEPGPTAGLPTGEPSGTPPPPPATPPVEPTPPPAATPPAPEPAPPPPPASPSPEGTTPTPETLAEIERLRKENEALKAQAATAAAGPVSPEPAKPVVAPEPPKPATTPEEIGKKVVPTVRREAMEAQNTGVEQPQPKPPGPEPPPPVRAPVVEMKPKTEATPKPAGSPAPVATMKPRGKSNLPPSVNNAYDKWQATTDQQKRLMARREFDRMATSAGTTPAAAIGRIEAERGLNQGVAPPATRPAIPPVVEPPQPKAEEPPAARAEAPVEEAVPLPKPERKHMDTAAFGIANAKATGSKRARFSVLGEDGKPMQLLGPDGKPMVNEETGRPRTFLEFNPQEINKDSLEKLAANATQKGATNIRIDLPDRSRGSMTYSIGERKMEEIRAAAQKAEGKAPKAPAKPQVTPEEKRKADLMREIDKLRKENQSLKAEEPPPAREEPASRSGQPEAAPPEDLEGEATGPFEPQKGQDYAVHGDVWDASIAIHPGDTVKYQGTTRDGQSIFELTEKNGQKSPLYVPEEKIDAVLEAIDPGKKKILRDFKSRGL